METSCRTQLTSLSLLSTSFSSWNAWAITAPASSAAARAILRALGRSIKSANGSKNIKMSSEIPKRDYISNIRCRGVRKTTYRHSYYDAKKTCDIYQTPLISQINPHGTAGRL
jgi:hypothetical protein